VYYRGMGDVAAVDVTGFILAGGKSTRMGTDKAFIEFEGRSLLERALGLARSVTPDVRIVGAREKFAPFAPVVEDIFRERGPLGGIHAALLGSQTELNFMLAVDMPFVSVTFLQYLIREARTAAEATVIVPRSDGRRQPLCAVYRRRFADAAEPALLAGRNRIDSLFDTVETRVIGEEELDCAGFSSAIFRNLNTPEQLEQQRRA
jgi:molybdenum cofactor guanylyltransferase